MDDLHYERFRAERQRQYDEDYRAWRAARQAARRDDAGHAGGDAGPLESLGRAVSDVVTTPADETRIDDRSAPRQEVGGVHTRQVGRDRGGVNRS